MVLGPLKKVANPMGSAQVAVIEKLTQCRKYVEPCRSGRRDTKKRKQKCAGKYRIESDLNGVFIEGGQDFNSRGTVVNLMENSPQKVEVVSSAMPPIE